MEKVIWKDIAGYEGYYQVSSHGQVRSLDRYVGEGNRKRQLKGKIMSQSTDKCGYKHLRLRKGGEEKSFFVHRLVAEAFIENPKPFEYDQINHKDETKENNHYSNLEWCTAQYNINYGTRNQRLSKPVIAYNDEETLYFKSMSEAVEHGFDATTISRVVRNIFKQHKGYKWRLA